MTQTETPPQNSSNDHFTEPRRTDTCETYNNMATMCDFYPEAHILFDAESLEVTISTPNQKEFEESQKNFEVAYRKVGGRFVKRSIYDTPFNTGAVA